MKTFCVYPSDRSGALIFEKEETSLDHVLTLLEDGDTVLFHEGIYILDQPALLLCGVCLRNAGGAYLISSHKLLKGWGLFGGVKDQPPVSLDLDGWLIIGSKEPGSLRSLFPQFLGPNTSRILVPVGGA